MNRSLLSTLTVVTLTLGTRLHGMEAQNSSWWPPSWLSASSQANEVYEPKKIKQLKIERDTFESCIQFDKKVIWQKKYIVPETLQLFPAASKGVSCPMWFIRYMYYAEFHKTEQQVTLSELEDSTELTTKCRAVRLDGYSALGALLIAKSISERQRKNLLQNLFDLGFQPTEKDRELSYLELYERTPLDSTRKALLWLICSNHPKNTSGLPHLPLEVIKHIARFITEEKSLL